MTIYIFKGVYTKSGTATNTSDTPTISVVDTSNNLLVNAQSVTKLSNQAGACVYSYSGADGLSLFGVMHTADVTMDAADLPCVPDILPLVKAKTDLIPASPAAVGDAMTLTSAYDAAKTAASQASITALGSPLQAGDYTAPDNAGIVAIKAKTDNLPDDPADNSEILAAIAASGGGAGSISWTITVTVSGVPKDGVDVWVTTDEAGANVIARGSTDDSGDVTFMLDAGTYYCWKQLAGYTFTNPESFTVS